MGTQECRVFEKSWSRFATTCGQYVCDNVATKTADPDVEPVTSDADLATVFTHAASVVLSADSAEALVVEPVVAEADGDDARPRLRPMYVP